MSKFQRIGTKIGGALGKVQRTSLDAKILNGTNRYEISKDQVEKILDRAKDTLHSVSGLTKHEKLAVTLKQTASGYGEGANAFKVLGEAMQQMGQEDRKLEKQFGECCRAPLESFINVAFVAFKREREALDTKLLDMDGAKNENQKNPSPENATKETEAVAAFENQKKAVEALIDQMNINYNIQAASMKAYAAAKAEYHANIVQILQQSLASMG